MLVDLMQPGMAELVREAGIKFPVAMTSTAYSECILPASGVLPLGQDVNGRLWDVLMLLRFGIKKLPPQEDRVFFTVGVWDGAKQVEVKLWALCGPGDEGEPVITVMLEGED